MKGVFYVVRAVFVAMQWLYKGYSLKNNDRTKRMGIQWSTKEWELSQLEIATGSESLKNKQKSACEDLVCNYKISQTEFHCREATGEDRILVCNGEL